MRKKIIVLLCSLTLLIGLCCSVLADSGSEIPYKDQYYPNGRSFDGFYSYGFPGYAGGVYLASSVQAHSLAYYDSEAPWLNAIRLELNGNFVRRSWSAQYFYYGSDDFIPSYLNSVILPGSLVFFYDMSMVSSPDFHVSLFFQELPEFQMPYIHVVTASRSSSTPFAWDASNYYEFVPMSISSMSAAFPSKNDIQMTDHSGNAITFNSNLRYSYFGDHTYYLEFDSYNLDVGGFLIIINNVVNFDYTDYNLMDGNWFDEFSTIGNYFPPALGFMFQSIFSWPFVGAMCIIAGAYLFVSAVRRWAG